MHFWGYNESIETSFFIGTAALQTLAPGIADREEALLGAFDSNRAQIFERATRVYNRGRLGISYDLTPATLPRRSLGARERQQLFDPPPAALAPRQQAFTGI